MAKYGSGSGSISVDDSGGTPRDLSQYIDTVNGLRVESILVDPSHTFGDTWVERLDTAIKQHADVTIEGWFDDTATSGPHVVLGTTGGTARTLTYNPGGSNTRNVEVWIRSYEILMTRGEMTRYRAVLAPTGAVT